MRKKVFLFAILVISLLVFSSFVNAIWGGPADVLSYLSSTPIKVMTYNVRFGCGSEENCGDFNTVTQNLVSVIKSQKPDIFVIQEGNNLGWTGSSWTKPKDYRDPFTALNDAFSRDYNIDGGQYANQPYNKQAIFVKKSRGKIDQLITKTYPTGGRIYERALITIDGQQLVVYNTHLFPPPLLQSVHKNQRCVSLVEGDGTINAQDFSQTEAQAKELAALVKKESLPVIVMGDLNAESDHFDELKTLSEVNLNSVKTYPVKEYCARTPEYGFMNWHQQLDHIYYNGFTFQSGEVVKSDPVELASDHYPVVASLTLDPSNVKKNNPESLCSNKKIAIIGASNDVDLAGRYPSLIRGTCSGSTVDDYAVPDATIEIQRDTQLTPALNGKPDVLIIDPSGNTCAAATKETAASIAAKGITTVKEVLEKAKGVSKIVLLTISPRKEAIEYANCITQFNAALKLFGIASDATSNPKYKVVDIFPTLDGQDNDGLCTHCANTLHWDSSGHQLVAKQILSEVFSYTGPLSTGTSIVTGSSSGGVAPQPGQQTGATVQIEQGCAINQRCKDIDSAWTIFGGVLGLHSGQVWVPLKNSWMTFNDAYGAKQTTQSGTASVGGGKSGGNGGSGVIECATADTSMAPEQKAFLDTIAFAEGTTRIGLEKGVSSYKIMVGGGVINDLSKHPGDSVQTQYGKSKAAGRYQNLHADSFTNGFSEMEQDKKAWALATDGGITVDSLKSVNPVWDSAARIWAAIRYDQVINFNTENWFKSKVEGNQIRLTTEKTVDSALCGNGHSFYCQGNGWSHETLTKAYNLCLSYYTDGGTGINKFNVNNGNAEGSSTSDEPSSEPTPTTPAGPVTEKTPTTSSSLKVLVVGDSHIAYGTGVNPFGRELSRLLRTTGAQVQSYGSGGSTAYSWMKDKAWVTTSDNSRSYEIDDQGQEIKLSKNKPFSTLKSDFSANVVIIVLGTNNVDQPPATYQSRIDASKEMAAAAVEDGATCYWVGPPQRKDNVANKLTLTVADLYEAVNEKCTFIDSRNLTDQKKMQDNYHYNSIGGKEWAQKVFVEIEKDAQSKNMCADYDIDIGDGYLHKCVDKSTAQACAPLTGVSLPEYSIAQIKDDALKAQLENTCTTQFPDQVST